MKRRLIAPGALTLILLVLHLCGGRSATATLAGIAPDAASATLGLAYVVAWFAFVLGAVPLLAIACLPRPRAQSHSSHPP